MSLKSIVDAILKEKHRSLSWLAASMGKTFDGLRLGLINESIKYKDMLLMAQILEICPSEFFNIKNKTTGPIKDAKIQDTSIDSPADEGHNLKSCRELTAILKDQIKDKERIIALLTRSMS